MPEPTSADGEGSRRATARQVALSKRLSYVLRHNPASVGLSVHECGWADVDSLLDALAQDGSAVSRAELDDVVRTSDKQRFAFDEGGGRIRANQGHSVEVDLDLSAVQPPATLFHGTVASALDGIRAQGLIRGSRHHVHLSADEGTAVRVGARRGRPVVLVVDAGAMAAAGFEFYCSANGVWLTEQVPVRYLGGLPDADRS